MQKERAKRIQSLSSRTHLQYSEVLNRVELEKDRKREKKKKTKEKSKQAKPSAYICILNVR